MRFGPVNRDFDDWAGRNHKTVRFAAQRIIYSTGNPA
jgi:hypothetical protein